MGTKNSNKPSEAKIIDLLNNVRPSPSTRFYKHMENAPWRQTSSPRFWVSSGLLNFISIRPARIVTFASLVIIAILGVLALFPSLRTLAGQLVNFFTPAESDQITFTVTTINEGMIVSYDNPDQFATSLEEIEELTEFPLKIIPPGNNEYTLIGAHYNETLQSVTLRYNAPNQTIYLSQRPASKVMEYSTIGATAPIQIVNFNGNSGEFVVGGWRLSNEDAQSIATITPPIDTELGLYWDNDLPQRALRWREGDVFFEILSSGNKNITERDLINIAESLE